MPIPGIPLTRAEMLEFGNAGSSSPPMILVIGLTGSGKSHFINKLAGCQVVYEGAELDSCTQVCRPVPVNVGQTKAIIVDTPGFNDTVRSDAEILLEISRILTMQYEFGVQLKGIIYLHSIADVRLGGSAAQNLKILREMCGDEALPNVMLVTSRWDKVHEFEGADRERGLRDKFWSHMLRKGSRMNRFQGDHHSATALVSQLLESNDSCVLDIQRELTDEGKNLDETSAGSVINGTIDERKDQYESGLKTLNDLRKELRQGDTQLIRKYQKDWDEEMKNLRQAKEQQVTLHQNVSRNVRAEVQRKRSRYFLMMVKFGLPILPPILHFIGMFMGGNPTGVTDIITSWFGTSSAGLFGSDDFN